MRLAPVWLTLVLGACGTPGANAPSSYNETRSVEESTLSAGATTAVPTGPAFQSSDRMLPKTNARIQKIFARILQRNELSSDTAVVILAGCEEPAASSDPATHVIRFCRGMLALTQSEDEIAFVLGHELAHIVLKHSEYVRDMTNDPGAIAARTVAVGAVFGGVAIPGAGGLIVSSVAKGLAPTAMSSLERRLAAINRSEEAEADLKGVDFVTRAGYNPRADASVLESLAATIDSPIPPVQGLKSEANNQLASRSFWRRFASSRHAVSPNDDLRNHPAVSARISAVNARIANHYAMVEVSNTPLTSKGEIDSYLEAVSAIKSDEDPGEAAKRDRNLAYFRAWLALERGKPETAIRALEGLPEETSGSDRWARMAAISFVYLNDKHRASEYADKHFLSGEWKRKDQGAVGNYANESIIKLFASPEIRRKFLESRCHGTGAGPGWSSAVASVCIEDHQREMPDPMDVRKFINEDVAWQE